MEKKREYKISYICLLALGATVVGSLFSVLLVSLLLSIFMILKFPFGFVLGILVLSYLILPFIYSFPFNLLALFLFFYNFMNGEWEVHSFKKRQIVTYGALLGFSAYFIGLMLMFFDSLALENYGLKLQILKNWGDLVSWFSLIQALVAPLSGIVTIGLVKIMVKAATYKPITSRHIL